VTQADNQAGSRTTRGWVRRRLIAIVGSPVAARSRDIRDDQRGERAAADRLYPTDHRKVQATTVAPPAPITGGAQEDGRDVPTSDRMAPEAPPLRGQQKSFHIG
jgi:hypothetical protein